MSQVDQSTVHQMVASKLVTAPSRCTASTSEISGSGLPHAAAKEAAQMFAPANVCTSSTRYVYAMPQCRPLRYVYVHPSAVS